MTHFEDTVQCGSYSRHSGRSVEQLVTLHLQSGSGERSVLVPSYLSPFYPVWGSGT